MPVFKTTQIVHTDISRCWSFFSNPANLSVITPPEMNFRILFPKPIPEMYQGMVIQYKVSPLLNIPMEWITEISFVSKPNSFIDYQLSGPYSVWHHQHHFEETPEGVLMTDIVTYKLPLGKLGEFFAGSLVKRKIASIFDHRKKIIDEIFR
ncbi:MAG: SRPBCC family protein [Lentimicrobium sp.]|nr:SRPBCC family protein [Lentimicrobium sp.]